MAMKGQATIMLFDAETGEMTDCIKSDNIVTNFFDAVLNGGLPWLTRFSGISTNWANMYKFNDFVKDMMGGVLIFSERIDSDPDHVYPTWEERRTAIGNGNQSTSIVGSTFKGAINASESESGPNYVTFVWDFSTEQCNGNIACICLTSNRGGHLGMRFDAKDSTDACKGTFIDPFNSGSFVFVDITRNPVGVQGVGPRVAALNLKNIGSGDGSYFMETPDKLYGRGANSPFYKVIDNPHIEDDIDIGIHCNSQNVTLNAEQISSTQYDGSGRFRTLNEGVVYLGTGYVVDNTITLYKFVGDLINPFEVKVPVTNIIASVKDWANIEIRNNAFSNIFNDKIVLMFGSLNRPGDAHPNTIRCYILNMDGSFKYADNKFSDKIVSTICGTGSFYGLDRDSSPRSFGELMVIDGELFLMFSRDNYGDCVCHVDINTGEIDTTPCYNIVQFSTSTIWSSQTKFSSAPYFMSTVSGQGAGNDMSYKGLALNTDYLATINNMDAVLTKTPDKTMKIVYTLTQI